MAELRLDSPLQYVKGVGPRKAEALARFGMNEVRDLLLYFPRHYLDRSNVVPIDQLKVNESATIVGVVKAHGLLHGRRRRYEVILEDDTGGIALLWFSGINYWERLFKKGQRFAATGTVNYYMGRQMIHPDMERLEEESDKMIHAGRIIPVYPQRAELVRVGLNSKTIRRLTSFIFDNIQEELPDYLPERESRRHRLFTLNEAIRKIHYPDGPGEVEASRRRLAFDELLNFQFLVFRSKSRKDKRVKKRRYREPGRIAARFKDALPFELTDGQKKAINEIFSDLRSEAPMARLLQGDVGCGKTVVAVLAGLYVAENGFQTAFMAPTEILAEQHYRNWNGALAEVGVTAGLLTSSLKASEKKKTAERCIEGKTSILFGTHALIYDYVAFRNLGLVIIDEQHRFGVEQRGRLYAKGEDPDLLAMTATPIPRTLALTLYGDLDISTIDTLPAGRKPIRTVWRSTGVREQVYQFVKEDIARGGQTYVVYPLIEKSDQIDLENVEDAYRELSQGAFRDQRVAMIHGRVKPRERDRILQQFRNREIDIMLVTTVIEVGIDNSNATVMIVEHAERFGLGQLHQLRGRIGRGAEQATLIAIAHEPISEMARRRLEFFAGTCDGFEIAEADLELRGPGEVFGVRQSGPLEFRSAMISKDRDLIEASRKLLERLFDSSNSLDSGYRKLYDYLDKKASLTDAKLGGG